MLQKEVMPPYLTLNEIAAQVVEKVNLHKLDPQEVSSSLKDPVQKDLFDLIIKHQHNAEEVLDLQALAENLVYKI